MVKPLGQIKPTLRVTVQSPVDQTGGRHSDRIVLLNRSQPPSTLVARENGRATAHSLSGPGWIAGSDD